MKSTGIVRQVDRLGRIVIPIELRRTMDISLRDALEISMQGDKAILKKYHPACVFCDDARDVVYYRDKLVCRKCLQDIVRE
jgi:AbrB family transcriptional regulator, transcriptional pleiotropic regulator of transition state genes